MTPVPVRVRCPMTECRFEHAPARPRPETGHGVELPGGVVLAAPDPTTGTFGVDRAASHLVSGHSLAEWITEVVRLREILADPDSQVAAARELQQLALERARAAEAERDAALAEAEQLRTRLRRTTKNGEPEPQRTTPSAECPVCGRPFLVRLDGRIRLHNQPGKTQQSCSGSGAEVEPREHQRQAVSADA